MFCITDLKSSRPRSTQQRDQRTIATKIKVMAIYKNGMTYHARGVKEYNVINIFVNTYGALGKKCEQRVDFNAGGESVGHLEIFW